MKCRQCSFEEQHTGIYCTECGAPYIVVEAPRYLYFVQGQCLLSLLVDSACVADDVRLSGAKVGANAAATDEAIHTGRRPVKIPISMPNVRLLNPETMPLEIYVTRAKRQFTAFKGTITVAVPPSITIRSRVHSRGGPVEIGLSALTDNSATLYVMLNSGAVEIGGLRLRSVAGTGPFAPPSQTVNIQVQGARPVPLAGAGTFEVTFDCSPIIEILGAKDSHTPEYRVEGIICDCGQDLESRMVNLKECNSFVFKKLLLPAIELGMWRSTRFGFACIAHNRAFAADLGGTQSASPFVLRPYNNNLIDDVALAEIPVLSDAAIHADLDALGDRTISFFAPIGVTRYRQFNLFMNLREGEEGGFDRDNNTCRIRLSTPSAQSIESGIGSDAVYALNTVTGTRARLGEDLDLGNLADSPEFRLYFEVPSKTPPGIVKFKLDVIRYRKASGATVDTQSFAVEVSCYKRLKNTFPQTVDFGTSNTCVAGPDIEPDPRDPMPSPVCYPLDFFRRHSEPGAPHTLPTALIYLPGPEPLPAIPDIVSLAAIADRSPSAGQPFTEFKGKLMEDFERNDESCLTGISPLKVTEDFYYSLTEMIETYYEDRGCHHTDLTQLRSTAPVGFIPELRRHLEKRVGKRLAPRYTDFNFRIDADEPLAAFVYSYSHNVFKMPESGSLLIGIVDIGGGTTDTAFILSTPEDGMHLAGTGGSVYVGGQTCDRWITRRLMAPPSAEYTQVALGVKLHNADSQLREALKCLDGNRDLAYRVSRLKECLHVSEAIGEIPQPAGTRLKHVQELVALPPARKRSQNLSSRLLEILSEPRFAGALGSVTDTHQRDWSQNRTVAEHLLFPFYESFYNQMKYVLYDTLDETFATLRQLGIDSLIELRVLLAGNCTRVEHFKPLIECLLDKDAAKAYPNLAGTSVVAIPEPKESVALGAFEMAMDLGIPLRKRNNPPFTLYLGVRDPRFAHAGKVPVEIIDRQSSPPKYGIVIFAEGALSMESGESGKPLAKVFSIQDLNIDQPDAATIPLKRKIGIDEFPCAYPIKRLSTEPTRLLFLLDRNNRISVYSFDKPEDLDAIEYEGLNLQ